MNNSRLKGPVELSVAADSSMMLVMRLTTAGVIARAGLTVDVMDNLKMAVEEACNCLIGQQEPPQRLNLTFTCEENMLKIRVAAADVHCPEVSADETELEIVRCILESLADSVAFDLCEGWIRAIELRCELV